MVEGCDSRVVVELRGQRAGSFARVRGYGLKRGVRLRGWGRHTAMIKDARALDSMMGKRAGESMLQWLIIPHYTLDLEV